MPSEFANEVLREIQPPAGQAGVDPFVLTVLASVVEAVIAEVVARCARRVAPEKLANPGLVDRVRLRYMVRGQFRRLAPELEAAHAAGVYNGFLAAAARRGPGGVARAVAGYAGPGGRSDG